MTNFELQPVAPPTLPPLAFWGWREIIKATLFMVGGTILVFVGLAGVLVATGLNEAATAKMSSAPIFLAVTAIYGFVILGVYLFAVRRPGSSWAQVGVRPFAGWWVALAPLLTAVQLTGMALINVGIIQPLMGEAFENPQIEAITGGLSLTPGDLVLLLILVAVIAPIAEELFFRGMLYPVLRRRWGVGVAVVVNALVFAVIHVIPILIPGLFFVGLILAWVRERSGSVLPTILMHMIQNGVVMIGIYAIANGAV